MLNVLCYHLIFPMDSYIKHVTSQGGITFSPKYPTWIKLVEAY